MPMDFSGIIWWTRRYFIRCPFLMVAESPLTEEFQLAAGNFLAAKLSPTESAGL